MNNPIDTANELILGCNSLDKENKTRSCGDMLFDNTIYLCNDCRQYAKGRLDSWKEEVEFLEELTKRKSFGIIKDKTGMAILILDRIKELQSAIKILENGLK